MATGFPDRGSLPVARLRAHTVSPLSTMSSTVRTKSRMLLRASRIWSFSISGPGTSVLARYSCSDSVVAQISSATLRSPWQNPRSIILRNNCTLSEAKLLIFPHKFARHRRATVQHLLIRVMSPNSEIGQKRQCGFAAGCLLCPRYCCKSRKSNNPKNLAKADLWTSLQLHSFSKPPGRSVVDFGRSDTVPHVTTRKTHQRF